MRVPKKITFPFMLVLLLFLVMVVVSFSLTLFFTYTQVTSHIEDFTTQIKKISRTLITTYADVASIAYATRSHQQLLSLLQKFEQIQGIKEVFFVLDNGKILAHTDTKKAQQLMWNIASDQFYYNVDLILYPHTVHSKELFIFDYFIPDVPLPFTKFIRKYIQKYVYKDIHTNSWLVTKAVYVHGKSIGTVNCIIVKTPLYHILERYYAGLRTVLMIVCGASLFLSLAIGTFIYMKQKKLFTQGTQPKKQETVQLIKDAIPVKE